jgi:alpha-glucoside transport system substrate-binding protein
VRRIVLPVLAVLVLMAGCSSGSDEAGGDVIRVQGPYLLDSADAFAAAVRPFEERTGIEISYLGSSDLPNDIQTALSTGTTPDVAILPQPGFVAELASRPDGIVALPGDVVDAVDANYDEGVSQLGVVDGELYGVVYKISPKSLVWYEPAYFAQNDLDVPGSLAELEALVATIEADLSPWCLGVFAFGATGWVMTDWIEDFLLRQAGPDAYDAWVVGDLEFDSPEVRTAMESVEEMLLDGRSHGGRAAYLRTLVRDAQLPMFEEPAECALHRQAGFNENWLPAGVTAGGDDDTDVFVFPPVDPAGDIPVMVGGDTAVMFNDDPAVREFMKYLATPESGASWAARGGYTGARSSVADLESYYPNDFDRRLAEIIAAADVVRFDASDLMPLSFGSGVLFEVMTDWVSGQMSIDEAVTTLDEAWEKLQDG